MEMNEGIIKQESGQYDLELVQLLCLRDQYIRVISNTQQLHNLLHLDLSFNEISKMDGLSPLVQLQRLDLSHNKIRVVQGLEGLKALNWLDLSFNKIENLLDTVEALKELPKIKSLKLGCSIDDKLAERAVQMAAGNVTSGVVVNPNTGNPCCTHKLYPMFVYEQLPSLSALDGALVALLKEAAIEAALASSSADQDGAALTEAELAATTSWFNEIGQEDVHTESPNAFSSASKGISPSITAVGATQHATSLMLAEEAQYLLRKADKTLLEYNASVGNKEKDSEKDKQRA